MTKLTFLIILSGVLLNALAQLLLKAGTNSLGTTISLSVPLFELLKKTATQPHILGGLVCYVFSVVIWIIALSRVPVSVAYPMLSIGYIVNAFAAYYLFNEALNPQKLIAIGIIVLGVFLLAKS